MSAIIYMYVVLFLKNLPISRGFHCCTKYGVTSTCVCIDVVMSSSGGSPRCTLFEYTRGSPSCLHCQNRFFPLKTILATCAAHAFTVYCIHTCTGYQAGTYTDNSTFTSAAMTICIILLVHHTESC